MSMKTTEHTPSTSGIEETGPFAPGKVVETLVTGGNVWFWSPSTVFLQNNQLIIAKVKGFIPAIHLFVRFSCKQGVSKLCWFSDLNLY